MPPSRAIVLALVAAPPIEGHRRRPSKPRSRHGRQRARELRPRRVRPVRRGRARRVRAVNGLDYTTHIPQGSVVAIFGASFAGTADVVHLWANGMRYTIVAGSPNWY